MYGISIKLWSSHFDKDTDCYKIDDSVVYVFDDSSAEDILYVANVVNHLTGDESLDALFRKLAPNIKGLIILRFFKLISHCLSETISRVLYYKCRQFSRYALPAPLLCQVIENCNQKYHK